MSRKNNQESFKDLQPHEVIELLKHTVIKAAEAQPTLIEYGQKNGKIAVVITLPQ